MLPFENIITIRKDNSLPVYRQISISIINAIRNGVLQPEMRLPGSRELAKQLKVHRKTVISAYEELDAQGWVTVFPQQYVMVAKNLPKVGGKRWDATPHISSYEKEFDFVFRLSLPDDKSGHAAHRFRIDDGHPDVRLSPVSTLLKNYKGLTGRSHSIKTATAGTDQGLPVLREHLANYLTETRGLNLVSENILITHGAQMCIYLSAQLLLGPGSVVVVGAPGYAVANEAFRVTGADLVEIPVDDYGIDTVMLEVICQNKKVTVVYVIPHHHYPTTVTLSVERRMRLLELSKQYGFTILEDDYDFDYHYSSAPYLPLASSHHDGNVIYIGSFSKMLDPAIRIGFMVAPAHYIRQATLLRRLIDVGGDGYMQGALATLIKDGELKRHIKKARKTYHQRRDLLVRLLNESLLEYMTFIVPSGGMAIWVKLLPPYSVRHLQQSPELNMLCIDDTENAFRFGFAALDEAGMINVVGILKDSLRRSNVMTCM